MDFILGTLFGVVVTLVVCWRNVSEAREDTAVAQRQSDFWWGQFNREVRHRNRPFEPESNFNSPHYSEPEDPADWWKKA